MSYKEQWKAERRRQRMAPPPIFPLPKDQIDRRFAALDARAMLYFPERELDFAAMGLVLAHAAIGDVRELWIDSADSLDNHALAVLAAGPLQQLEVLGLRGWKLNDAALAMLLDAPALAGLRELVLAPGNPNTWPSTSLRLYLPTPPAFPTSAKLERLRFGYPCTPAVAATLAAHPAFTGLQTLDLSHTQITDAVAAILAAARHLDNLREINLSMNQIGPAGAAALGAARWPSLQTLELVGNRLGEAGMQALGNRTGLPNLRKLSLAANGLPDIEWEVKVSDMTDEEWITANKGGKPPTQDYIERRAVSGSEIAGRFFPGQAVEIS
ncbi:MAG TPA: hypothetical protein VFE47_19520 [Tepidisphaeraceae bacterium]|jgi:hypothetical protein|nr:hypothetical protein [Tepidisphaeraceae bacterium]